MGNFNLKFLIALSFSMLFCCARSERSEFENCHKIFLKTLNYDDNGTCLSLYSDYIEELNHELNSSLQEMQEIDIIDDEDVECTFDTFERYNLTILFLKRLTKMKLEDESNNKSEEMFKNCVEELLVLTDWFCLTKRKNDENFLNYFIKKFLLHVNDVILTNEDKCNLNYLIDYKIINNQKYQLNKFKSINNCDDIYLYLNDFQNEIRDLKDEDRFVLNETFSTLTPSTDECMEFQKYLSKTSNEFTFLNVIESIIKAELNDEQKMHVFDDIKNAIEVIMIPYFNCLKSDTYVV